MEDKINKYNNNPDYDAGYEQAWDVGWQSAIEHVLDILKQMGYNNPYITPTLKEVEQRIV
jgi:hypothetical protein